MSSTAEGFSLADWPAAILAGGLATRLRPITETIPKALIAVADEPFLAHQLRLLHAAGIRKVVLCVGYLGEMIEKEFGDGRAWGIELKYSFDGASLLGTGGALKNALPFLGEKFLILYGDSYLPVDYAAPTWVFATSGKLGLMTVFKNEDRWDSSNVWFENGKILRYDKRQRVPEMRYIDYGLGILRSEALRQWPAAEPFDLADVYRGLAKDGCLVGYEVDRRFYEIGSPRGLAELDAFLRSQRASMTT